jgi:hypothetical protein
MKSKRFNHQQLPDSFIHKLASRDCALWIGDGFREPDEVNAIVELLQLPWRLVLCESADAAFAQKVEDVTQQADAQLTRVRGFLHLVASNPAGMTLPPQALPIFLLNGRTDAKDPSEATTGAGMAHMLRRLNMLNVLATSKPTSLVVVCRDDPRLLLQLIDLWTDGFRSLLVVASTSGDDAKRIDTWLSQPDCPSAVDFCPVGVMDFADNVIRRTRIEIPEKRVVVRMQGADSKKVDLDITSCDLAEQPILDRYSIIRLNDLRLLQPEDLSQEEFTDFFDKSTESWAPYGAGLPWQRNAAPIRKTVQCLKNCYEAGHVENQILCIASEPGAGGTTLARSIAFAAASEGFPALVARCVKFRPEATEIASFLYRVRQQFLANIQTAESSGEREELETPWLIVFDVQHWDGREGDIRHFLGELTRSGRPTVVLAVTGPEISEELRGSSRFYRLDVLSHELNEEESLELGHHINRFLKPFGKDKSDAQWQQFFEAHRPNVTTHVASFWIALEFWLKGYLDLSESIQSWLFKQFKQVNVSDAVRCLLLEIAALSIERQPLPEGIMPTIKQEQLPLSVVLEHVRSDAPALALVRDSSASQRQWAMAHDLLGRYLVTSTYFDRKMLERLSLSDAIDPVSLRLRLLRRVATRSDLARRSFLPLALEFPVTILKLDFGGNTEFFRYWRDVISILKEMPQALRDSNRTFNHHVAISCRRVVKMKEYFDATVDEKRELLSYAISRLEYAINSLDKAPDDETDLNLFNSLSLSYQDLAELEQSQGASDEDVRELRKKAEMAARRAHDEGPSNSYVLETMARNVLQNGELYPNDAVQSASEALGLIYQALSLDRSELRQAQLTELANRALRLLRSSDATVKVERLCSAGNPLGLLARAWLALTDGVAIIEQHGIDEFPPQNRTAALAILDSATAGLNWMLLRFKYDLICTSAPLAFDAQLDLLDELESTGYRMSYQLQLERVILMHQCGRHHDANSRFSSLRRELKKYDVIVNVPKRLQWLLTMDRKSRQVCGFTVIDHTGYRAVAKVRDLGNATGVPLIPQDFGKSRMGVSETRKCHISFGPMGPFIKPVLQQDTRDVTE